MLQNQIKTLESLQTCHKIDLKMRSSPLKTTNMNGIVAKVWRRFGKYATLCQVIGDKRCQVVMVVVGCSFLCLLAVLGPSLGFPVLDWYLLVPVVSAEHSGVPVLTGHSLCKWCFPVLHINTSANSYAIYQWLC